MALRAFLAATTLTIAWTAQSMGRESVRHRIDIPRQELSNALKILAQQARIQFVYPADLVAGRTSRPLNGSMTSEEALEWLLSETKLKYEFLDAQTVTLTSENGNFGTAQKPIANNSAFADMHLTQAEKPETAAAENAKSAASGSSESQISEVIVTAQKRAERLQDVPISISVLGGEELDQSRAQGLTEALRRVPGVAVPIGSLSAPQVVVRGVSSPGTVAQGGTTTAYYLDNIPYSFVRSAIVPDIGIYDLDRIEVLRGPQGTLFGANAQNGAVRILSQEPDLDAFAFKARGNMSTTDGGGQNTRADMAVNVPIITDRLGARIVYGHQDLSGWIDKPLRRNSNDVETEMLRFRLLAQPTDRLSILASSWNSSYDASAQAIARDDGTNRASPDEPVAVDTETQSFVVSYDFDDFSVMSATGAIDHSIQSSLDLTLSGPATNGVTQQALFASEVFSQEITVSSDADGVWRWSFGGIYRDVQDEFARSRNAPPATTQRAITNYIDESQSWAAFGEVTRTLFDDQFEVTAGLRYFEDQVASHELIPSSGAAPRPLIRNEAEFDSLTPRAVLTWLPSNDLTVYASYAQGFRSGMPQNPEVAASQPQFPPVESDLLTNYELGAKGALFGGRVRYDTAVFYIDWQDVQQNLVVPFNNITLNALINGVSASGPGFEIAVSTTPLDGLELAFNLGWNDLSFDENVMAAQSAPNPPFMRFREGDRLLNSPEYIAGASVDYTFALGGGFTAVASASANYMSAFEANTRNALGAQTAPDGDEILLARASFSIEAENHWSTTLFVENITNEQGATVRFSNPPDWDARNNRPLTFGVQLEYSY